MLICPTIITYVDNSALENLAIYKIFTSILSKASSRKSRTQHTSNQVQEVKSRSQSQSHVTVTSIHHTLSLYLSSLPLSQTQLAVALNDCAKDHLHKDHCMQAFGRNTLSLQIAWHAHQFHEQVVTEQLQGMIHFSPAGFYT